MSLCILRHKLGALGFADGQAVSQTKSNMPIKRPSPDSPKIRGKLTLSAR